MTDILLELGENRWDAVLRDGDFVLTHEEGRAAEVAQRVVFRIMTWLGESPYQRDAGVPYEDAVFGETPVSGIGIYLVSVITSTEGVDGIEGQPVFDFDPIARELSISVTIQVGEDSFLLQTELAA